jgi:hypothetical protein
MDYHLWNKLISEYFFKKETKNSEFYLSITREIITEIGKPYQRSFDDFIDALRRGPKYSNRSGICQMALDCLKYTKKERLKYPEYVAYLALFVLAVEDTEGDLDPRAYYPRLRSLLGEDKVQPNYPSFSHMIELWEHFEYWLNKVQEGRLGIFRLQQHRDERWKHVSIPISQVLLTEKERRAIHAYFDENPNVWQVSNLTETAVRNLLLGDCAKNLRHRTIKLLKSGESYDEDMTRILLQRLVYDLQNKRSQGAVFPSSEDYLIPQTTQNKLRLCLRIDETAEQASFGIRYHLGEDASEDDVIIKVEGMEELVYWPEYGTNWSSLFAVHSTFQEFDATLFDWINYPIFATNSGDLELGLKSSKIRVFTSGQMEGIPNLMEISQLSTDQELYFVVHVSYLDWLNEWGRDNCSGFKLLHDFNGLPKEWQLCYAKEVFDYKDLQEKAPHLFSVASPEFKFRGGLRVGKGNDFFSFAPPRVALIGNNLETEVFCNDILLEKSGLDDLYTLPRDISCGEALRIEARCFGKVTQRSNLFLRVDFSLRVSDAKFDNFGDLMPAVSQVASVRGALAEIDSLPNMPFTLPITLSQQNSIYLVGSEVGQIAKLPFDRFPIHWSPIWGVQMESSLGQAIFCGSDISEASLIVADHPDERMLREWKELLWERRGKILPPSQPTLRKLWKKFQSEVKHVC